MNVRWLAAGLGHGWLGAAALLLALSIVATAFPVFGAARLAAVPDGVDLGRVEEGAVAAASVSVENVGDVPVAIINVRTN